MSSLSWYDVQDAIDPGAAFTHAAAFAKAQLASGAKARDLPRLARASWSAQTVEQAAKQKAIDQERESTERALQRAINDGRSLQRDLELSRSRRETLAEALAAERERCARLKARLVEAGEKAKRHEEQRSMSSAHIANVAIACVFFGLIIGMWIG